MAQDDDVEPRGGVRHCDRLTSATTLQATLHRVPWPLRLAVVERIVGYCFVSIEATDVETACSSGFRCKAAPEGGFAWPRVVLPCPALLSLQ
jgi:hypothetical protein